MDEASREAREKETGADQPDEAAALLAPPSLATAAAGDGNEAPGRRSSSSRTPASDVSMLFEMYLAKELRTLLSRANSSCGARCRGMRGTG